MSDSIPPARAIASGRRVTQRRFGDPLPQDVRDDGRGARREAEPERRAPAPEAAANVPAPTQPEPPKSRLGSFAAFAAQILGQGGQKRGLRGGPETLDHARAVYLETEYSGPSDRRPRVGRITRTEI